MMEEVNLRPMTLRPGGSTGANPFSAFSKGAGVKSATQNITSNPHKELHEARKKAIGGRTIKYSADFLMQFRTGLVADEDEKRSQMQAGSDGWRSAGGAKAPSAPDSTAPQPSSAPAPPRAAAPDVKIQKASDIGRQAWQPAKDLAGSASAAKTKLRGILNKLTPDNFDKLVAQVLSIMSASADVLTGCIPLIFEKAVAEPTFCELYAQLCTVLANELGSHDYGLSEGKPITFKRELLNTCQDQFEGMEDEREALDAGSADFEEQKRRLKVRQLGTVRLLAELFNKDLVTHPIMRIVVQELMATAVKNGAYDGDLIECIVQAISIAGSKMSTSEKLAKPVKDWLKTLEKWSSDSALEARIRFKIKDLLDQVRAGWQTRRETNTVKKTKDVRAQAHAELGMIQTALPDFLPNLALGGGLQPKQTTDNEMSAMFPGMDAYGMPEPSLSMRPDGPDAAVQSSGPAKGTLSNEDVEKKAAGTFAEFLSIRDVREAETCVKEIAPNEEQEGIIIGAALNAMYNAQKASEQTALIRLLVTLHDAGCITGEGFRRGLAGHTEQLEDLALDVPMSPMLLGRLAGAAVAAGVFPIAALEGLLEKVESSEPKRHLFRHFAKCLVEEEELGEETVARMIKEGGVNVGPMLDADAEFEPGVPSVPDFLKMEGLTWVPL